jgi:hypothetical protein
VICQNSLVICQNSLVICQNSLVICQNSLSISSTLSREEERLPRQAHNLKIVGSNPTPALLKATGLEKKKIAYGATIGKTGKNLPGVSEKPVSTTKVSQGGCYAFILYYFLWGGKVLDFYLFSKHPSLLSWARRYLQLSKTVFTCFLFSKKGVFFYIGILLCSAHYSFSVALQLGSLLIKEGTGVGGKFLVDHLFQFYVILLPFLWGFMRFLLPFFFCLSFFYSPLGFWGMKRKWKGNFPKASMIFLKKGCVG